MLSFDEAPPANSRRIGREGTQPIDADFVAQAARSPQRMALAFADAEWTYADLERARSALATRLVAAGVVPGDVVAIVTDRCATLVCAVFATIRAGGTFVLLDAKYPLERIHACLRIAKAKHVLLVGNVPSLGESYAKAVSVTALPGDPRELEAGTGSSLSTPPVADGAIAYLSFTSGSTGQPKCIATGHRPLRHFIDWHRRVHALSADDSFAMVAGLSHDPLLRDIFTPLAIGARLHIPPQSLLLDPRGLFEFVSRERITVLHCTPQLGYVLSAGAGNETLPCLRRIAWGGDVLRPDLLQAFHAVAPKARHVNFYGTTETPQAMGFHEVLLSEGTSGEGHAKIPIGRGIDDVELLVLNEQRQKAQPGEVGELLVRTPFLSLGYLDDPAATAAKYIANPITGDPADRCYRTGDLACYLPDGNVEFRGRADDQVKIRGFRVELGEIANVLRRWPSVQDVQVLARAGVDSEPKVYAYVTTKPGQTTAAKELEGEVSRALPDYMRPAGYVLLDALPRLANGKVDRLALLALPVEERKPEALDLGPMDAEEKKLVLLWKELLGVESVSINESFFDLGGDSLTAVRVMLRMRSLGMDENTCRLLFQGKSIAEIAAWRKQGDEPAKDDGYLARLTLNILRGWMVVLVLADHWYYPLARRIPRLQSLESYLQPIFSWPTPGFAIVFGMTIAFVYCPMGRSAPRRLTQVCKQGAAVVGFGSLLFLLVTQGLVWVVWLFSLETQDENFLHPELLTSPLHYYFLAMLSIPLWVTLAGRKSSSLLRLAVIAVGLWLLHSLLAVTSSSVEVPMITGKYAYFNLTAGVFAGMTIGASFKARLKIHPLYAPIGAALVVLGGLLSRDKEGWGILRQSWQVEGWKWLFFVGATLLALPLVWACVSYGTRKAKGFMRILQIFSVLGQLAFPLFILDFATRKICALFDLFGAHPLLHPLVAAGTFGLGCVLLVRKAHRLFFAG
jgi:amino acid adenylation domain-containing protein